MGECIFYLEFHINHTLFFFVFQGVCEKTVQDVVERFWDIIEDINISKLLVFLRDNIVGTVVLISALIWIPASCLVNYVDKRRLYYKSPKKEYQVPERVPMEDSNRFHDLDSRKRVINVKVGHPSFQKT